MQSNSIPYRGFIPDTNLIKEENASTRYYDKNYNLHRDEGPAIIYKNGNRQWYRWGVMHRVGAPATIYKDLHAWYHLGKLHRDDGPAFITSNRLEYYQLGKLHRTDGPAVVRNDSGTIFCEYHVEGKELGVEGFLLDIIKARYAQRGGRESEDWNQLRIKYDQIF